MRTEDSLIAAFGTPITEAIRKQAPGITLRFVSKAKKR
jgi:hypothetical protein